MYTYPRKVCKEGGPGMENTYLSEFVARQEMAKSDFEIFHRDIPTFDQVLLHSHDFVEFYYLLGEDVNYVVNGQNYPLSRGKMMIVAPGALHKVEPLGVHERYERIVMWINLQYMESLISSFPRKRQALLMETRTQCITLPDRETKILIEGLLFSLLHERERRMQDSDYMIRLILMQLFIHLCRFQEESPETFVSMDTHKYENIMKIYHYIEEHVREELTVSSLASIFYMDKKTMTRKFQSAIGMTPGECIRLKRLERAHLLIYQGVGMQQASEESGFSDYSAFYRAFRQVYGTGPREYYAALGKKQEALSEA